MNTKTREEQFLNPGIQYRSKPFWAWNGKLEEKELYRQLDILKEMGFGGAFMHSRVGLETEYLGSEWMELVEKCLEYGNKIGLELWLYDEDRWPSGSAGGMVTEKKENRSKRLQLSILDSAEAPAILEEKKDKIVKVSSCILKGHEYQNLITYEPPYHLEEKTTDGEEKLLLITIEESAPNDNYNGYTYLDTMKESAVEDYLVSTHDAYEKEISKEAKPYIKGVFTDEPHRGGFLTDFSEGNRYSIPYTDELFEAFKEAYGYDLKDHLEDIFLREEGKVFSKVASDYVELAQELFLKNFMEKIQKRCHEYGWKFTGHLLHEDLLVSQTCMLGSLMSGYEYMDIPGIDLLGEKNECWWIGKQLTSVAHQMGQKEMLTELFGCTGWQMKFENYKAVGDWQAMMGINLFCPHLSWYTMKGENKRDYPASIFYQSAWYKQYRYMEDYFARIHVATEGTPSDCHLLVLNPIESVWARAYSEGFGVLSSNDEGIWEIEKQYQQTFCILMMAGIDFDYGEERVLARHASVEQGKLKVGCCVYDKVLLSGVETMKESTLKILKEFVKQGGEIIIAGKAPERIKAVSDERVAELVKASVQIPFTKEAIAEKCQPEEPLYVLENHGSPVCMQSYEKDDVITFVVLNLDRENSVQDITLTICGKEGSLEIWNARNGHIETMEAKETVAEAGKVQKSVTFAMAAGEEKIFALRKNDESKAQKETFTKAENEDFVMAEEKVLTQKEFKYTLSEENIAVLDCADVYLEEKCVAEAEDVLKADRKVRSELGFSWRGGEMMQPWYTKKYFPETLKERKTVKASFHFNVEQIPERMSVAVEAEETTKVYLNGELLEKEEDFWIDTAISRFSADAKWIKEGRNEITVEYCYGKDSGLENIYLLGDFGVKLMDGENHEITLTKLPKCLKAGNIVEQNLPFYSGAITYELDEEIQGEVSVSFEEMPAALAVLHGETDEAVAFAPYEASIKGLKSIEMVFNRRNTFGPLHLPLAYKGSIGPDHFLTNGIHWCDEMQLYAQGLPEKICVKKREEK